MFAEKVPLMKCMWDVCKLRGFDKLSDLQASFQFIYVPL